LNRKIIIIGAGAAGITAALHLVKNNCHVILIEAKEKPGGRLNSLTDAKTGDVIDNGQHLLMGAYHNFLEVLKNLKTDNLLFIQNRLYIPFYGFNFYDELSSKLPGKIGFISAFLKLKHISVKSKLNLMFLLFKIQYNLISFDTLTCELFLKNNNQNNEIISFFWEPLVLATLNCGIKKAPASLLVTVLKKAFLTESNNSKMILSKVGLSKLVSPIMKYLIENNSEYLGNTKVKSLIINDCICKGVILNDGTEIHSDYIISTVQPNVLLKFIPESYTDYKTKLSLYQYSPIISVYLWFDNNIFDFKFAGIINSKLHWIFNKRKINENSNKEYPGFITLVISAANEFINLNSNEIKDICINELSEVFPDFKKIKLLHFRVIKEKMATFEVNPVIEIIRLSNITPIKNLFVAGDWTNTKLPATIEGASVSGKTAAALIISDKIY
jgi:squalene-associated FAD-dependent desaturase